MPESEKQRLAQFTKGEELPERFASRFQYPIIPGTRVKTADERSQDSLYDASGELLRSSIEAFENDSLKDLTGLGPNLMAKFNAMRENGLSFGDVRVRAAAVNALAEKILALSGKAVTDRERAILGNALPDLSMDSGTTLLEKSMVLHQTLRRLEYQKNMNLNPAEMEQLVTLSGSELETNRRRQLMVLDALQKSQRNGRGKDTDTITVGKKTFTRKEAKELVREANELDFKILTRNLRKLQ
jgi:hypothetical protein